MSVWQSVFTVLASGVFAALVTFGLNWWLTRLRADLRMIRSGSTAEDVERLIRARPNATEAAKQWQLWHVVRLTNYGDGTAYDLKLTGTDCRPRVWVADTAIEQTGDAVPENAVVTQWPMWSDRVSMLAPGESVHVLLMCLSDDSRNDATVAVSWTPLPGRQLLRRRQLSQYALKDERGIETGWPGQRSDPSK